MAAVIRANFAWYDAMIRGLIQLSGFMGPAQADNRIEIYSGTMPSDANDWVQGGDGSPANLLVTFSTFRIQQHLAPLAAPEIDVQEAVFTTDFTPDPGTVNASATGTAAWYAMYDVGQVAGWGALLGNISLSGGNGSMHLDSLSLVIGQPVQLLHWGVRFQS
jgi:hypothetical protein